MNYDEESDTYMCHAGKKLKPIFVGKQKSKSGYESEVTVYECRIVRIVLTRKNVPAPKETRGCIFPKVFWKNVRNHMKIS